MRSRATGGAPTGPLDLRLLPAAALAWAAAAWAVAQPVPDVALAATGIALPAGAALRRGRGPDDGWAARSRAVAVLAAAAVVVVLVSTAAQTAVARAGPLPRWAAEQATVRVQVTVRSDPRPVPARHAGRPDRTAVHVRVDRVAGRGDAAASAAPVLVLGERSWSRVRPGERYTAVGRLAAAEAGERVVALLFVQSPPRRLAPAGATHRAAERLRAGLRTAAAELSPDAGGLLPALVVGDTSTLPPDLAADMRSVGLAHLTAVSGSNTTLVCGAALLLAAAVGLGRRARLLVAGGVLAGFVVLARPEPSVLRAAVMGGIGLLGLAAGRPGRGLPVLLGAVVALLAVDPWLSRQHGFALSALATAGLLLLAGPWARWLQDRGLPRSLAVALAVPAAAQAACGPVVVLLQPETNLLSIPVNVLAAPAVAPATVLGLATALLAPWSLPAARVPAHLGGVGTGWIAVVARVAATAPTTVPLPAGIAGASLLAAVTVLLVATLGLAVPVHRRRRERRHPARRCPARYRWGRRRLVAAGLAVLAAGLLWWVPREGAQRPPEDWLVAGCDVGQGDAVVLRSGEDSAVLVDTGPDPEAVDECLDRLGVARLEAVVLTHFHADHVDGLPGVLRGREVAEILVSPLRPPGTAVDAVERLAAGARVPVRSATAGAAGRAGRLSWRVLAPVAAVAAAERPSSGEVNDSSVVLLAEVADLRVLLLGDLEEAGQRRLLSGTARWPGGPVVDVVKVAHHGSAAQEPRLYTLLRPRVALVQAGAGNDYGHPAPEALALLQTTGARVLRTDRDGGVLLCGTASALRVVRLG